MQFSPGTDHEPQVVHVGRQPVFNRAGDLVGYELLFRGAFDAVEATSRNAYATSRVVVNAFTEFGLAELVGDRRCFINLTREFMVGDIAVPFEPGQVVLEIMETVEIDEEVLAGVANLVDQGYAIALDDFVWGGGHEELLPYASYVKLDVLDADVERIAAAVAAFAEYPKLTLVAERVETEAHVELVRRFGFTLLQGHALGRPEVISTTTLAPSHQQRLALFAAVSDPTVEISQIIPIVMSDSAMAFRILRAANSTAYLLDRRVASVREAVVMLGVARLRQWVTLMLVSDVAEASEDQVSTVMARARLCQSVAERLDLPADPAFTVGLLSGMATLLDTPVTELIDRLPLTQEVADALTRRSGRLGDLLRLVEAYEATDETALVRTNVASGELARAYLAAVGWSAGTAPAAASHPTRRLPPVAAVPRHAGDI